MTLINRIVFGVFGMFPLLCCAGVAFVITTWVDILCAVSQGFSDANDWYVKKLFG